MAAPLPKNQEYQGIKSHLKASKSNFFAFTPPINILPATPMLDRPRFFVAFKGPLRTIQTLTRGTAQRSKMCPPADPEKHNRKRFIQPRTVQASASEITYPSVISVCSCLIFVVHGRVPQSL
jgi:hypothetical protein